MKFVSVSGADGGLARGDRPACPMKALILVNGFQTGGAERNLVDLIPHLVGAGIHLSICTLSSRRDGHLAAAMAETGVERIDLDCAALYDIGALRRLDRLLCALRPDVLHSQDQHSHILTGLMRMRRSGPAIVMTRHVIAEPDGTTRERLRARMTLASMRRAADRVLAVSEAAREHLVGPGRIPPDKVTVVFNGLGVEPFASADRAAARTRLGVDPSAHVAVMVGVMRPGKGHDVLFAALPELLARHPEAVVLLAGDGPELPRIRAAAGRFGDAVRVLGGRDDIPDLLAAADALVLPSWSEALPTVLLEAGAAGLPVVATDVGGCPEIVEHGQTGFLIPKGNAGALAERLGFLLSSPDAARRMGERGRARVLSRFSLPRQARETAAVYRAAREVRLAADL